MIQEACTYVEKTPNLDVKLKLIDTLRTVTDGKVGNRICCCTWRGIIFYVSVYLNGWFCFEEKYERMWFLIEKYNTSSVFMLYNNFFI